LWHFLGLGQGSTTKFEVHTFAETTAVHFSKLSEQEIAAYIARYTLGPSAKVTDSVASVLMQTKQQASASFGCCCACLCELFCCFNTCSTSLHAAVRLFAKTCVCIHTITQVSVMGKLEPMASKEQPVFLSRAYKGTTSMSWVSL